MASKELFYAVKALFLQQGQKIAPKKALICACVRTHKTYGGNYRNAGTLN